MFDEPVNGLDPEGVLWIRTLIRGLAAEGRTVFVSSHLMSEMESTADHLIVVGRGRLIADLPIRELIAAASGAHVIVRVEDSRRPEMISILSAEGADLTLEPDGGLKVVGLAAERAGALAHAHGIPLAELSPRRSSLEDAYFELTEDAVEYRAKEVAA
jgi:ABC-2 type transport system ATP-binding protein